MAKRLALHDIDQLASEAVTAHERYGPATVGHFVPRLCEAIEQLLARVDDLEAKAPWLAHDATGGAGGANGGTNEAGARETGQ